ncbi:MAG: hypothetical protein LBQ57_01850 [Spirochaetales bacterium]|nr:hypothetical protein [Spirochaetales bacterium]
MKMRSKLLIFLCLLCLAPVAGFSLFDGNIYGGLPFSGEFDNLDQKFLSGENYAYGASAHLNGGFLGFLQLGLGGFYQLSAVTYESAADDFTVDKTTAGIEAYAQFEIPFLPIAPYVKANTAAWNKLKGDGGFSHTDNFKKHGVGAGVALTVLPVPLLLRLQLFAEYMYNFGKEDGKTVKQHNAFVGLRLDFF